VNPRIGSDLQYGREVEEEKTAEVVRNHEGGTRTGIGVPVSKAAPSDAETQSGTQAEPRSNTETWSEAGMQSKAATRRDAAMRSGAGRRADREPDSSIVYDGGAIFGQPHERKPGFAAGSQGPKRVGKAGVKVRRVARVRTKVMASGPIEGPRGPERGNMLQGHGGQQ